MSLLIKQTLVYAALAQIYLSLLIKQTLVYTALVQIYMYLLNKQTLVYAALVQIYLSLLIQTTAVLASAVTNGHLLHARNVLQEAKRGTSPPNNTHILFHRQNLEKATKKE